MLKYFQDRREQKQLLAAFKERAAVQCWTLLEILKRNDGTLVSSSQWLDEVQDLLQKGLDYGERQNFRAATLLYSEAITKVLRTYPGLIANHPDLVAAIERAGTLKRVIEPLWDKHQDKLVKGRAVADRMEPR